MIAENTTFVLDTPALVALGDRGIFIRSLVETAYARDLTFAVPATCLAATQAAIGARGAAIIAEFLDYPLLEAYDLTHTRALIAGKLLRSVGRGLESLDAAHAVLSSMEADRAPIVTSSRERRFGDLLPPDVPTEEMP